MHYKRWRTHGDPLKTLKVRKQCTIEGCETASQARGYCKMHWRRWRKHGDPLLALPKVVPGPGNSNWRGDEVSYNGAHKRIYGLRGPASAHGCSNCFLPAEDWAYAHLDPEEMVGENMGYPAVFSVNPSHYVPLCKPCHKQFDMQFAH